MLREELLSRHPRGCIAVEPLGDELEQPTLVRRFDFHGAEVLQRLATCYFEVRIIAAPASAIHPTMSSNPPTGVIIANVEILLST